MPVCRCYFCENEKSHPVSHDEFHRISDRLLVAESLDPKDRIFRKACVTCGHIEEG